LDLVGVAGGDGTPLPRVLSIFVGTERPVADLDRVSTSRHLDDRGRADVVCEVTRERLGIDRGGGDHDLQFGPLGEQECQVPEQEVDVEAALVRLVDYEGVVGREGPVARQLRQQHAVRHYLYERAVADPVRKSDLVPDGTTQLRAELVRYAFCNASGRDPPRLGVPNHPSDASASFEADLGQLGALARPGLTRHDHDLVSCYRGEQLVAAPCDGEFLRVPERPRKGPEGFRPCNGARLTPSGRARLTPPGRARAPRSTSAGCHATSIAAHRR
jgi:hypothetical protein